MWKLREVDFLIIIWLFREKSYLCRRKAALGNLKASFHCARLHFLCTVNQ